MGQTGTMTTVKLGMERGICMCCCRMSRLKGVQLHTGRKAKLETHG